MTDGVSPLKMKAQLIRENIIRPVLQALDLYSESAVQLLLGTAIQESHLTYRRQLGDGPALGLWQMEPMTHEDCWDNYLHFNPILAHKVLTAGKLLERPMVAELQANDSYACAMARVKYLRIPDTIPFGLESQAAYWLKWYNAGGKGSVQQYLDNWNSVMGE